MKSQGISSKLGEIKYRSQIVNQHLGKKEIFENEPTSKEFFPILQKRQQQTGLDFKNLRKQKLLKSPFLEVGAEYGLASSLLINKFNQDGIALDISATSLKHAKYFAQLFKFKKLPKLICADIDSLPFQSNYFPFVFVYESLHHFPNPKSPLKSLNRVLSPGGTLLIGSEPIKPILKLNLWNRPNKLRPFEKVLKALIVLPFISNIGKTEIEHGIIETSFPIQAWIDSLSIFDNYSVTIDVFPLGQVQKLTKTNTELRLLTRLLIFTLGGTIKAVCRKKGTIVKIKTDLKVTTYICAECLTKRQKEIELQKLLNKYRCPECKVTYPMLGQIPIFLQPSLQKLFQKN